MPIAASTPARIYLLYVVAAAIVAPLIRARLFSTNDAYANRQILAPPRRGACGCYRCGNVRCKPSARAGLPCRWVGYVPHDGFSIDERRPIPQYVAASLGCDVPSPQYVSPPPAVARRQLRTQLLRTHRRPIRPLRTRQSLGRRPRPRPLVGPIRNRWRVANGSSNRPGTRGSTTSIGTRRFEDLDLVNEDGPLFTLGYMRRNGPERFRGELFGSQVDYSGGAFDPNTGIVEPLKSHTTI